MFNSAGSYHIVIKHRNHLAIGTDISYDTNQSFFIDFTDPATPIYGTDAQVNIENMMMMHAGDASGDGAVNAMDSSMTWDDRNLAGYLGPDLNLDGFTNAVDRYYAWIKRNTVTQVP